MSNETVDMTVKGQTLSVDTGNLENGIHLNLLEPYPDDGGWRQNTIWSWYPTENQDFPQLAKAIELRIDKHKGDYPTFYEHGDYAMILSTTNSITGLSIADFEFMVQDEGIAILMIPKKIKNHLRDCANRTLRFLDGCNTKLDSEEEQA